MIAATDLPLSIASLHGSSNFSRECCVVIFAKTSKEIRKVRFKVCTDLIENNSHRLFKHVTVNLLV